MNTTLVITKEELESIITQILKGFLTQQPTVEESKFIDIGEFIRLHPKHPAKPTVYSQISKHQIPKDLIYKPKGTKQVLFYRDLVLQWIDVCMPTQAQKQASEYLKNGK